MNGVPPQKAWELAHDEVLHSQFTYWFLVGKKEIGYTGIIFPDIP